jgi:hypothetical protein
MESGATPKKRKHHLGKVAALKRSFEIEDVITGKRLKLGGPRQPYYGVVIGISRKFDDPVIRSARKPKPRAKRLRAGKAS